MIKDVLCFNLQKLVGKDNPEQLRLEHTSTWILDGW